MVAPCILKFLIPFGRFSIIGIHIAFELLYVVCNNSPEMVKEMEMTTELDTSSAYTPRIASELFRAQIFGLVSPAACASTPFLQDFFLDMGIFRDVAAGANLVSPSISSWHLFNKSFFVVVDFDFEMNNLQVFFKENKVNCIQGVA